MSTVNGGVVARTVFDIVCLLRRACLDVATVDNESLLFFVETACKGDKPVVVGDC